MPFNVKIPGLGSYTFTGHTGSLLPSPENKTTPLHGKPATATTPAVPARSARHLPPAKRVGVLPHLSISKTTYYTQLPNAAAVNAAILTKPAFASHQAIFDAVTAFLNGTAPEQARGEKTTLAALRARPGMAAAPTLIIVAENHRHHSALTALIGVLAHQQVAGAGPGAPGGILMREASPDKVASLMPVPVDKATGNLIPHLTPFSEVDRAARLLTLYLQGDPAGRNTIVTHPRFARQIVKHQLAHATGFVPKSIDLGRDSDDSDKRESQMVGAIATQLANEIGSARAAGRPAQPMVVNVGAQHLSEIMTAFEGQANVLGVVSFEPPGPTQPPNNWNVVPRRSYNLTHPAVYAFQVTPAVEAARFNYSTFAAANGVDVTA
jgi:hypothetical protein